jgi:hypothetical protein
MVSFLTAAGLCVSWLADRNALDASSHRLGVLALPIACVVGALLLVRRDASTDALALGLALPLAALHALEGASLGSACALVCGLILGAVCLALALQRPGDAARSRVIASTLAFAPLVPLLAATLLWAPRHYTMSGWGERVALHPLMVLAALSAVVSVVELQRRSARALVALAVTAIAIDASPSWGEHQSGCMRMPGPVDWIAIAICCQRAHVGGVAFLGVLLRPPVLTLLALVPWAGPVWRALRPR